jgi:hypothetical protein
VSCGLTGVRAASSALFFSCLTYALNKKSSAQLSATVFQNGGSACTVGAESCWGWIWKVGLCVLQIPKSGHVAEVIAIDSRASATSAAVIVGGGIVNIVVVTVGDSGGEVRGGSCNGIPGSVVLRSVKVPVCSERRASGHGADASG